MGVPSDQLMKLMESQQKKKPKVEVEVKTDGEEESDDEFKEVKFWEIDHDLNSKGCIRPQDRVEFELQRNRILD